MSVHLLAAPTTIDYSHEPSCGRTRRQKEPHDRHGKMVNLPSRDDSTRKIEDKIRELRNGASRQAGDREALDVKVGSGRNATGRNYSTTAGRYDGLKGPKNSKAVEELEGRRRKAMSTTRDRS
ncbi:unnamed protein product [Tuber aestivum]|uniref:Uncharacterized protein n=1 Tax=Tuber aestivum TaxID=59557 RepID=A0A292PLD2_9PEZI|nr:unnamed protein product [Tuber aestivum]